MANTKMGRVYTIITMISVSVIWVSMPIVPVVIGTGISFGLTFFASPISIRMGIGIRGNMGNNWGDGMGDLSGLVFYISHGGGPGYRHSYRGNMRKTVMIEKLRISLGFTLFASIPSPIIWVGMGGSRQGLQVPSGAFFFD